MNTKNNLDEKKLTVDTENNEMHPEPDVPVQESKVDTPQAEQIQDADQTPNTDETSLTDQPKVVVDSAMESETETVESAVSEPESVEETPASEPESVEETPASEPESVEETPASEPESVEETPASEPKSVEDIPASEPKTAEEPTASEPESTEETPASEEAGKQKEEQVEKIDYHLEDGHTDESEETSSEGEGDEGSDSSESAATLLTVDVIVQKLRELLDDDRPQRKEIDEYKNQFYRSLRNEIEGQKQSFLSAGGEEIDFVANEPPLFTEGKELLQKIREKRAAILAMEEAEKEKNVARKLAIIEQVKLLTQNQGQEDFNKIYQEFKSLQQEWNEIRLIPQARVNELWKSYQHYVEIFYDLVRINNEFREYDFKKNLELKTELCEAAERLDEESDVVSAFHQLQNLHQEWREIGPVSRKDREDIWNRFKEASTSINKKYQAHFEALRSKEDENLELKTALCEKLEAIDYSQIKTIRDWNNKVKEVLEVQTLWRQIGYVPRKWNTKIYKRYRAACDFFFRSKNDFYKSLRNEMEENLRTKIALCERAEEMKESQDWKKTTQEMIEIQKEWKSIGIVPHKYVDSIWKRFITACDYFFEQKKMHTSSQYEEESKNLEAKKEIVEQINLLDPALDAEQAVETLRGLMDDWYAIGHVPYKLKDRVYREFYDATEAQFDRLNIDKAERKLESFKTNVADMSRSGNAKSQLLREREKLMRQFDRMKNELQTYENNIGFLSVSSKKGNHLVDDMNQKVERIKAELQLIVKKIDTLDKEL